MGIRFQCHVCNEPLHVKFFQAGKRGRCPHCQSRFRIPNEDSDFSIPLDATKQVSKESNAVAAIAGESDSPPVEPSNIAVATLDAPPAEPQQIAPPASSVHPVNARWFVRPPSGGVFGPADTRTLESWIAQRRVTSDSYIWREGMELWSLAIELMPAAFTAAAGPEVAGAVPPPISSPIELPQVPLDDTFPNAAVSKAKANLEQRRKKKTKQTWIILGLLLAIAAGLLATLYVVLSG
jgi:hypothetical protein